MNTTWNESIETLALGVFLESAYLALFIKKNVHANCLGRST